MMRSIKKGIFLNQEIMQQVAANKKIITTSDRACTIVPEFIGFTFLIHNGKKRFRINVISEMIGHKLGEFAPTRNFKEHTVVTKRSRQKVKK